MKNGLTKSLLFFFRKRPKIWVGRTTLNGEKKEDGLRVGEEYGRRVHVRRILGEG